MTKILARKEALSRESASLVRLLLVSLGITIPSLIVGIWLAATGTDVQEGFGAVIWIMFLGPIILITHFLIGPLMVRKIFKEHPQRKEVVTNFILGNVLFAPWALGVLIYSPWAALLTLPLPALFVMQTTIKPSRENVISIVIFCLISLTPILNLGISMAYDQQTERNERFNLLKENEAAFFAPSFGEISPLGDWYYSGYSLSSDDEGEWGMRWTEKGTTGHYFVSYIVGGESCGPKEGFIRSPACEVVGKTKWGTVEYSRLGGFWYVQQPEGVIVISKEGGRTYGSFKTEDALAVVEDLREVSAEEWLQLMS